MSALDVCEPEVIRALEKEGWRVLEKPYLIHIVKRNLLADMSLQKNANGSAETIIVVEVKCFTNPKTDLSEFYAAVGQYQYYRNAMSLKNLSFPIFLAIPQKAWRRLKKQPATISTIRDAPCKISHSGY
jgi:hypothetical protein